MQLERGEVTLVSDNCSAHIVVPNLTNVEILYLSPNITSDTQLFNEGIIQALSLK